MVKSRRDENSDATRQALLYSAREVFMETPYADASIEDIVRRARVTRGALYHHFKSKQEIFETIFVALEVDMRAKIAAAIVDETDAWKRTERALTEFVDACAEPVHLRIVLREGPSALGWARWRELEERYALDLIRAFVGDLMSAGIFEKRDPALNAQLIFGLLVESALTVAASDGKPAKRREIRETLIRMVSALKADQPKR